MPQIKKKKILHAATKDSHMPQQRLKIPPATTETHCSPYHFGQQDFSLQAISAAERKKKPNDANDNALRTFLHA